MGILEWERVNVEDLAELLHIATSASILCGQQRGLEYALGRSPQCHSECNFLIWLPPTGLVISISPLPLGPSPCALLRKDPCEA